MLSAPHGAYTMSAEVAQNDGSIEEETSVAEAESKLRERYQESTFRTFESTGTIHVIIGQDEVGENNCRENPGQRTVSCRWMPYSAKTLRTPSSA